MHAITSPVSSPNFQLMFFHNFCWTDTVELNLLFHPISLSQNFLKYIYQHRLFLIKLFTYRSHVHAT